MVVVIAVEEIESGSSGSRGSSSSKVIVDTYTNIHKD